MRGGGWRFFKSERKGGDSDKFLALNMVFIFAMSIIGVKIITVIQNNLL